MSVAFDPDPNDDDIAPGRVPPHNTAAERSLLGAWLLSTQARTHHVNPHDWYHPTSAVIADAITTLDHAGQPVDPVTVADQLERDGNLDRVGGPATLTAFITQVPATTNAHRYAAIIRRHAHTRRLIQAATDLIDAAYNLDDQALEEAQWALLRVIAETTTTEEQVGAA